MLSKKLSILLEKIWDDYDFKIETRFFDEKVLSKIRWYSNKEISTTEYLTRPMVFVDIDSLSLSRLNSDPTVSAATYACSLGGAFLSFDPHIDSGKIRDGDVYIYAGKEARKRIFIKYLFYDFTLRSKLFTELLLTND